MQNKSTSIIIGVIIVILIIVSIVLAQRSGSPVGTEEPTGIVAPLDTDNPSTSTPQTGEISTTTRMKTYTLAEVALHSTSGDCWTTINGDVYDLTPFVTQHPGGVPNISKVCGKDGTEIFTNKHSTQPAPNAQLAKLKIGILTQ